MKTVMGCTLGLVLIGLMGSGCLQELPQGGTDGPVDKVGMRGDTGHYTQLVWADSPVRSAYQSDVAAGDYDLVAPDDDSAYHCGLLTCTCDDSVDCDEMHDHLVTSGPCSSTGDGNGGETCCIRASCNAR